MYKELKAIQLFLILCLTVHQFDSIKIIVFSNKVVISLFVVLSVVANLSSVFAAEVNHHHKEKSAKILFPKLTDPLTQSQHICPVHFHIMDGPYCKMKNTSPGAPEDPSNNEESLISKDCGGLPPGSASIAYQLNSKVAIPTMPDEKSTLPCSIYIFSEFIDNSQCYFNTPEKPPQFYS